jgi:hypothetical protein
VSDTPKAAPIRVRRAREEPQPATPSWQDVLYRGAAATATGEHVAESTGMFRILAEVPEDPVTHNRRATDRQPAPAVDTGQFRTRASDRGPARTGSAADRADGSGQRAIELEKARAGTINDRTDASTGQRAGDRAEIPAKSASELS